MPSDNLKKLQDTLVEEFGKRYLERVELPAYFAASLSRSLRPYQADCFRFLTTYLSEYDQRPLRPHLLFHMATGSGKTLIMAGAMLYLYEQGYRNFLFFVDSANIVEKTRDNFLNPASDKYLFSQKIEINGKQVEINEVENFQAVNPDNINFCLTTIQGLHTSLNTPRENSLTIDDFAELPIVLIADEAHHINKETREGKRQTRLTFDVGEANEETTNWEQTVMRIFRSNDKNMLLEFTATADLSNPYIAEKYYDKIIFDYPLRRFREDGFSKDIEVIEADLAPIDRALQAVILSQYKRKLFASLGIDAKPVVMFKSKTIKDNKEFQLAFVDAISHLNNEKIAYLRSSARDDLARAFDYFNKQGINEDNLILELREEFSEERLLLVDGNTITPEKQQYLNSLESPDNAYRAVFAVDMLNEGWDVLNLYDIVRLYDTRDANNNRPGKTTLQEAQLIGRGARYFAFTDPAKPDKRGVRKYDDDMQNPLRVIEKLHYHSQHNPRYIQELHTALVDTGIIADKYVEVEQNLKDSFKQSRLYQKGYIFKNEQQELPPEEKNKDGLSEAIRGKVYEVTMPTGQLKSGDIFGRYPAAELAATSTYEYKFSDLGYNVTRTAINHFSELHFCNLHRLFPSLTSIRMFIEDEHYLRFIKIRVHGASDEIEQGKMSQKNRLFVATEVLRQIVPMLNQQEKLYKGTTEFKPVSVRLVFKDHTLRFVQDDNTKEQLGKSMNDQYNQGYFLDLSKKDWYAYTDCFGTAEEKELIKYIDAIYSKLHDKYQEEVWLVRNELDFKIYSFDDGRAFAPDFVLFLRRKVVANDSFPSQELVTNDSYRSEDVVAKESLPSQADYDNLQIFIEPKGTHLIANDQWKQDFLNQIAGKADLGVFTLQGEQFNIYGLPFFNTKIAQTQNNFEAAFRQLTDIEMSHIAQL